MALKLNRYTAIISNTEPSVLEGLVRGLLIHYFFHVSDKGRLVIFDAAVGMPRTINVLTPTVFKGAGIIRLAPFTVFGVPRSPGSYACTYIEARTPDSLIEIGDQTVLNNRAFLLSEGAHIRIGSADYLVPNFRFLTVTHTACNWGSGIFLTISRRAWILVTMFLSVHV